MTSPPPPPPAAPEEAGLPPVLLCCRVTNNPVGTDTWPEGLVCPCNSCQYWLRTNRRDSPPAPARQRGRGLPGQEPWVIRKRGAFYRTARAGYTINVAEAGLYTRAEAEAEARIEPNAILALPLSDFLKPTTDAAGAAPPAREDSLHTDAEIDWSAPPTPELSRAYEFYKANYRGGDETVTDEMVEAALEAYSHENIFGGARAWMKAGIAAALAAKAKHREG